MLELSRTINPEAEHILGDMRTLRLGRTFDAVLIHDAICYMTTEASSGWRIRIPTTRPSPSSGRGRRVTVV